MPWATIAITAAALALIGAMIYALVITYGRARAGEAKQAIAEAEQERMRHDAEIAAGPFIDRPAAGMRPKKHLP